jgi:hypothetical protein
MEFTLSGNPFFILWVLGRQLKLEFDLCNLARKNKGILWGLFQLPTPEFDLRSQLDLQKLKCESLLYSMYCTLFKKQKLEFDLWSWIGCGILSLLSGNPFFICMCGLF